MRASIVIPVWNGASVIEDCLESVYANASESLLEVICVDNGSLDDSADRIAARFPQVRLMRQLRNLGFAGGVNAGIDVAEGDVYVLLNQDCLVLPGWLEGFAETFARYPQAGIAGLTMRNRDGSVNHAGAVVDRPLAYSRHYTEIRQNEPYAVEYVTGAVFAITQRAWQIVGRFDEGYYPAYYEEADYCYRARQKGLDVLYVPGAEVTHLFTSREAAKFPFRVAARQHKMRYRFVVKHFSDDELADFFAAEADSIDAETFLNQLLGRSQAARETLQGLDEIIERRLADLGSSTSDDRRGLLRRRFSEIAGVTLTRSAQRSRQQFESLDSEREQDAHYDLQQKEHDLLRRIYFRLPQDAGKQEPLWKRFLRLFVLRPLSFVVGRDYLLLAQLNTYHVARLDKLQKTLQAQQAVVDHCLRLIEFAASGKAE
jgi:GT2 family glycosyltransferase